MEVWKVWASSYIDDNVCPSPPASGQIGTLNSVPQSVTRRHEANSVSENMYSSHVIGATCAYNKLPSRRSVRPGFTARYRGFLKPGARRLRWREGDSSVSGKFSRTIDHYRFNEAKWTAFRFTYRRLLRMDEEPN